MYLVVGLGNPGDEYVNTRHNIGFKVIDRLGEMYKESINRIKFKGICGEIRVATEKVILLKPTTYMNLSGESVVQAASYYNIPDENIIIIHDDVSLDVGRMRIRTKGSSGGQNGVKNIILNLGTDNFNRVKVGVGKPERDLVSHVMGNFPKDKIIIMEKAIDAAAKSIETIINEGVVEAMNKFNGLDLAES